MAGMSQNTQVARKLPSTAWKPGKSANPGGRRREEATVRELAMSYAPAAIHQLAKLAGLAVDENGRPIAPARNENSRIAALNSLLDRAIGRPRQDLAVEGDGSSLLLLHMDAARAVSAEIIERMERRTINGQAESGNGSTSPQVVDLSAPSPLE
jgi:hypothetical protein